MNPPPPFVPCLLLANVSVPSGSKPKGSGGGAFWEGDLFSTMIAGVVILVLGVVLVAVFQQWWAGRKFRRQREVAAAAAKGRPKRFTGDLGRRR